MHAIRGGFILSASMGISIRLRRQYLPGKGLFPFPTGGEDPP